MSERVEMTIAEAEEVNGMKATLGLPPILSYNPPTGSEQ